MTDDPEFWERELNPRVAVPNAVETYGEWPKWAAATRAARPHRANISYGPHPRDLMDIFPAAEPKGTVVFIHGGYWRAFSKDDFSWVAEGFVDLGYTTVVLNYPLCPQATLREIVDSTRRGLKVLIGEELGSAERDRIVVTGHSAGGYLTALALATDWTAMGLPRDPFRGAVPISGVFELAPLIHTTMNAAIGLDAAEALALSLSGTPPKSRAKLTLAVGGLESVEFHRQSEALALAWSGLAPQVLDLADRNHFTILDDLRLPGSPLHRAILETLD